MKIENRTRRKLPFKGNLKKTEMANPRRLSAIFGSARFYLLLKLIILLSLLDNAW